MFREDAIQRGISFGREGTYCRHLLLSLLTLLGKGFGRKDQAQPRITGKRNLYSKDFL
jgi:hypothetical protein